MPSAVTASPGSEALAVHQSDYHLINSQQKDPYSFTWSTYPIQQCQHFTSYMQKKIFVHYQKGFNKSFELKYIYSLQCLTKLNTLVLNYF